MAIALNPITGKLDMVRPDNFSFYEILEGQILTIPIYQQMIVKDEILVSGDLAVNGQMVVL